MPFQDLAESPTTADHTPYRLVGLPSFLWCVLCQVPALPLFSRRMNTLP